ncbi:MAG: alpha/beta hydrolase [Chloroflexi bacterium]|nr:alpha/beta hydrolase [Chloroflexota bacterium]
MADFLLVHDAGHGAWSWDRVWGLLDDTRRQREPIQHELYAASNTLAADLPGHGTRYCTGAKAPITLADCVSAVVAEAQAAGLQGPVVAAHGLSAMIALEAARQLKSRPRRLVLLAGVVPRPGGSPWQALPTSARLAFAVMGLLPGAPKGYLRFHRELVLKLMCNDMPYHMASTLVLGHLRPFPSAPFRHPTSPSDYQLPCPVTYVVLGRDRFVPPEAQRQMADRLAGAEVVEIDSSHEVLATQPEQVAHLLLATT